MTKNNLPKLTGIHGMRFNHSKDLVMSLKDENDNIHEITISASLINGLLAGLIGMGNRIQPTPPKAGQPAYQYIVRASGLGYGFDECNEPLLILVIEGNLAFPVTFSWEMLDKIQSCIASLRQMRSSPPDPKKLQ